MRITYKQIIFLLLFFALDLTIAQAQIELDVSNAKDVETAAFICSKSFHISPFQGAGNTTMNDECIPNEVNAVWLNWESLTVGGDLTFTITPDNPNVNIDFILFESDNNKEITNPDPRKCSTSNCSGVTGLRTGAANAQANPGTCNTTTDNGFLSPAIQFQKFYALLIHSTDDDNGFTIEFAGSTEFAGPRPSIVSSIPNEACYGQDLTFSLPDSFDDTDVISYEWDFGTDASVPPLNTADKNDNPAISYSSEGEKTITLTVESAVGCRVTTEYTMMIDDCCTSNNSISVDTTLVTVVSCPSDADGTINIEVQTTSPLTPQIEWSNGETSQNLTGLGADTYGVTVTNEAGCEAILDNIVLETPDVLKLEIPDIFADGCGAGSGIMVTAEVEGGRAPYEFNFGQTQDTLPVDSARLTIGGHLITVKDASGCKDSDSMYVLPPTIELETANLQNAPCKDSVGSVEIVEILGSNATPYTYDFGNGLAGDDEILKAIPASDDTYVVTVTDAKECTGTVEVNITEPEELTPLLDGDGFIVNCFGETASISADATGGTPIYDFVWEDGSTEKERDNLPAGTYQITITDDNGCSKTDEAVLGQPEMLEFSIVDSKDASCASDQDGEITISAKGGTGDYAFRLTDDGPFLAIPTDSILKDLAPADYNITLQDENGCTSESVMRTIDSPESITITDVQEIDVTKCDANNDGGIIITAEGGSGPGTYLFTFTLPSDTFATNTTGQIIDSLPAGGPYTVFIKDANGCTAKQDGLEISKTELEVDTISTTNLSCNGDNSGAVALNINGSTNTDNFSFEIANDNIRLGDTILSALSAGIPYEIEVYNVNGCQGTAPSFTLTEPEEIRFIAPTNRPICFGASNASVALDPSGGAGELTVFWSTNETGKTISGLSAGDYTVRVEDENECSTGDIPFTITENPAIEISNIAAKDVACPDNPNGSITFDVQGGIFPYEYSIDGMTFGSNEILENLTANTYSVLIRDAAQCDTTVEATIKSPVVIDALFLDPSCYGDEVSFSGDFIEVASGDAITGISWSFGEGATPAVASGNGPHDVMYTTVNTTPEVTLTVTTQECGEISPKVINGAALPNSFTIESCCDLTDINVTAEVDSTTCFNREDGKIELTINPDIAPIVEINWDNGGNSEILDNLKAGTYSVTITDEAECTATSSVSISSPEEIEIFATSTNPSCGGGTDGTITIDAEGGSGNYEYDFGGSGAKTENSVDDFPAGTYDLLVVDDKGCRQEGIITLAEKELETDPATITQPNCFGEDNGSVEIRVTNGTSPYEYNINGNGFEPSTALSNLSAGNYSISIKDAAQCQGMIDVIVTEPDEVDVNMRTVQNISCFGERDGQLLATATGGDNNFKYAWDVGGTDALLTNLSPGNYNVTVTDGKDCSGVQMGLVVEPDQLAAQATPRAVFCFGQTNGAVTVTGIGGTAPYAYSMDGVFFQPVETFNNLPSGDYDVFVQDAGGCTAEAATTVDEPSEFSLIATQDQEVLLGSEIQLQAIVTDDTGVIYSWSGPDSLSCNDCPNPRVSPSRSGTYFVTATNPGDCFASDTIQVLVNFDRPIYFPEAFTPNGDGINDRFYIQGTSAIRVIKRLSIFDRFGSLLYDQSNIQPNDPTIGWDGILDGRAVNIGVYVVRAEVEFIDREVITYTRDVTLAKNNQ